MLMVTDMEDGDVGTLGARKVGSLQEAMDTAFAEVTASGVTDPSYYVMPSAAYTVPFLPE